VWMGNGWRESSFLCHHLVNIISQSLKNSSQKLKGCTLMVHSVW